MIRKYFKMQRDSDGSSLAIGLIVSKLGVMIKASPSLWYDKREDVRKYHLVRLGVDHCKDSYVLVKLVVLFFILSLGVSLAPTQPQAPQVSSPVDH